VECGLIEVVAAQNGFGRLELGVEAVEGRKQGIADSASDADLVIIDGHHPVILRRRWVTKPHPAGMTTHTHLILRAWAVLPKVDTEMRRISFICASQPPSHPPSACGRSPIPPTGAGGGGEDSS